MPKRAAGTRRAPAIFDDIACSAAAEPFVEVDFILARDREHSAIEVLEAAVLAGSCCLGGGFDRSCMTVFYMIG